jgi:hypothetical protein
MAGLTYVIVVSLAAAGLWFCGYKIGRITERQVAAKARESNDNTVGRW